MAKGAAWLVGLRWAMRGLGLLSTIILARLLTPQDYGIANLAIMVLGILDAMSEFRIDFVLIQKSHTDRTLYNTAWTLTVLRGAVMAVLAMIVATPWSQLFDEPALAPIVYVLAFTVLLDGFRNVGTIDFFRDLTLEKEFWLNLLARGGGFLSTVLVAIVLRNYWALIAGYVASKLFFLLLSYVMSSYRPRFSLNGWRSILSFSLWMWVNSPLIFLSMQADNFVLGKIFGAEVLGYYAVARRISDLPGSEFVGPVRNSLFPGLARVKDQPDQLRRSFVGALAMIMFVGVPAAVGIGVTAEPFVRVVLGAAWADAAPLIEILMIGSVFLICGAACHSVFLATGRPDLLTMVVCVRIVALLPLLPAAVSSFGAAGAAWATSIAAAAVLVTELTLALRRLELRAVTVLNRSWRTLAAAAVMGGVVLGLRRVWPNGSDAFAGELAACVMVGATTYIAIHSALWHVSGRPEGPEQMVLARLRWRATSQRVPDISD